LIEEAKPFSWQAFQLIRTRYRDAKFKEDIRCTLQAADSAEFIDELPTVRTEDDRVPMVYKGVLAKPGIDVATGQRVWFVRAIDPLDPSRTIESVKGNTVIEVVDKAVTMFGIEKLEKYQVSVDVEPPPPVQSNNPAGWRSRPGSRR
jgi:hypothetical protein